jgi:ABC-2 type transport system ATP-binding protein
MLSRLKGEGMTILLSSHLLHQVQAVCDRVGIFVGGRLIAMGPVNELERQLAEDSDVEVELGVARPDGGQIGNSAVDRLVRDVEGLPGVRAVRREGVLLVVSGVRDVRLDILGVLARQGLVALHLRQRGLSLDDIYDRYFREEVATRVSA